jgi:hypothetical protein
MLDLKTKLMIVMLLLDSNVRCQASSINRSNNLNSDLQTGLLEHLG